MEYERSTQARNWLFNEHTLDQCRKQALVVQNSKDCVVNAAPRKFASGFHHKIHENASCRPISSDISISDQETLVRFHSHQLQTLCGPMAILDELRTSQRVLFTAITFVRRFYLSNSVLEFHPRIICIAAVFLAGKVEEEKVELGILSHATFLIENKLCGSFFHLELPSVSIDEIERAEKILMEGINYEFICHHSDTVLHDVALDLLDMTNQAKNLDGSDTSERLMLSSNLSIFNEESLSIEILDHFLELARRAHIFSDVSFLFSPLEIGYAIAAVCLESYDDKGHIGDLMQDYLVTRYPLRSEDELLDMWRKIQSIKTVFTENSFMDIKTGILTSNSTRKHISTERLSEVHKVMTKVEGLRLASRGTQLSTSKKLHTHNKRKATTQLYHSDVSELYCKHPHRYTKFARITPPGRY